MNYFIEDIMGYGKSAITLGAAILFGTSAYASILQIYFQKYGYRKVMLGVLFTGYIHYYVMFGWERHFLKNSVLYYSL